MVKEYSNKSLDTVCYKLSISAKRQNIEIYSMPNGES